MLELLHVMLTDTAPKYCAVAGHGRPIVDNSPPRRMEAAAVSVRRVVYTENIVEDDRAICIPPQHLNNV